MAGDTTVSHDRGPSGFSARGGAGSDAAATSAEVSPLDQQSLAKRFWRACKERKLTKARTTVSRWLKKSNDGTADQGEAGNRAAILLTGLVVFGLLIGVLRGIGVIAPLSETEGVDAPRFVRVPVTLRGENGLVMLLGHSELDTSYERHEYAFSANVSWSGTNAFQWIGEHLVFIGADNKEVARCELSISSYSGIVTAR